MNKSDFYYDLPAELIAQHPEEKRDESRMLVLAKDGSIQHRHFYNISDYLEPGDCLILNDTKVLPARLYGVRRGTGAVVEFLLLNQHENGFWECIAGPGKKAKKGDAFDFADGVMRATVEEVLPDGNRMLSFEYDGNFYERLDEIGTMPLPPYITERLSDKSMYQTVYAKNIGSAAAPTAGFHFTKELLEDLKQKGVNVGYVTLHVGLGTFRPVKTERIEEHKMHTEHFYMPQCTADLINETKKQGKRVICVGTTSCRTVESVASSGEIRECSGDTDIFIYPGYKFKCMDALITNFHLPESTLIMLVSAFEGYENTMNAYKTAVKERYRFFSFGDCMFLTGR